MAIHPLAQLGFASLSRPGHPLKGFGFAPAAVTIGEPAGGRLAVQPTHDVRVNQALATAAMPAYTEQLAQLAEEIPGAKLAAARPAKNPARLAEKIVEQGQAPQTVSDYGAARIGVESPDARDAVVEAVAQRFPVLRRQDNFRDGDGVYHYRSDTLQVQMPNQSSEELQIVPKEVLAANRQEHHDYKAARNAELAGEDSEKPRAAARALNDAAMAKFAARNGMPAAPPAVNHVVKGAMVKGARVRLADGAFARVLYVDPSMRIVRVRTENGRNLTVRRKDLR